MTRRPVPPHLADPALTYMPDDGQDEFVAAVVRGFHDDYQPELLEPHRKALEPDRTFGYQVDGRWIATRQRLQPGMSVPGGSVPTAAVTVVTVSQSYRRRAAC